MFRRAFLQVLMGEETTSVRWINSFYPILRGKRQRKYYQARKQKQGRKHKTLKPNSIAYLECLKEWIFSRVRLLCLKYSCWPRIQVILTLKKVWRQSWRNWDERGIADQVQWAIKGTNDQEEVRDWWGFTASCWRESIKVGDRKQVSLECGKLEIFHWN